ncbi:MAG: hypothetical protein OEV66_09165 [Spirochaetia bacterium]|nr:hypothetical protein [Spirochaetia bacterium]
MSQKLFKQSQGILKKFVDGSWPESVIFSGTQTPAKRQWILDAMMESMFNNRSDDRYSREQIRVMVEKNEHPDFYFFAAENVKIGDKKNPDPGSIRHLLSHFLMYSPRFSNCRFVFFEDAACILNEAESALLKSLEEAPVKTHFVLSVDETRQLKETIVSRCLEIPLLQRPEPSQTPADPWERFWYFSQSRENQYFELMQGAGWFDYLKGAYDKLSFKQNDFTVFEDIGWIAHRRAFSGESAEAQNAILKLSFLPLYSAIRDRSANGKLAEISPISLPAFSERKLLLLGAAMEHFFRRLNIRYFNTRHPAMNVLFFGFLSRLMRIWSIDI